jgi:hypothetical protein
MKYPKINSLDIENKILIACLGIGILTAVFFWVYKQSKKTEAFVGVGAVFGSEGPLDATGTVAMYAAGDAMLTQLIVQENNDINSAITDMEIIASTEFLAAEAEANTAALAELNIADTELLAANETQEAKHGRYAGHVKSINDKAAGRVQTAAEVIGSAADLAGQAAQMAVTDTKTKLRDLSQTNADARSTGMQTHGWKIALLAFLAASGIGAWAISNIEVLIYRITNFKSCFFWYFLEIIGWLFYLPIEFIVWLFCLQDLEKYAWKGLDRLDCSINGITGFYLFKHSDAVNQKCYSKVFTPFPSLAIPFSFDTIGNYMNDMYEETLAVPAVYGGENQLLAEVEQKTNDAKIASEAAIAMDAVALSATVAQIGVESAIALS